MKKIVLLTLLFVSNFSQPAEITQDYAYGAEINIINDNSMFNRVDLNSDVYTQTISNSLDDVRVFNRNGQPVPFSLVNVYEQNNLAQTIPMTIYPLDESHRINQNKARDEDDLEQYNININSKDINISLDKSNNNKEKYSKTYLLQVSDNTSVKQGIRRLSIDFDETATTNWQATATLLYSYSLKDWTTAITNVPIMSLEDKNNHQSLKLNTIDIAPHYDYTANYWLLTLQSQRPIPEIKNINVLTKNGNEKIALYPISFSLASTDKQEAIYRLPSPQPIKELSIELKNTRTVLPMSIYYKSSDEDKEWHKLNDYMIRRVDSYDEPQRIMFDYSPLKIKQLQIKAINASFDEAPKIIAYRDRMNIVFNSANNGPFILAWGSAKASPASLSQQDLLSNSESVINLPEASIGNLVTLGGENALTISTESSDSQSWIVWLCLIAGAAFLLVLALKLIKEIKKTE